MTNLTIGVVGMVLIGGSLVKAAKKNTKHKVYGFDISTSTVQSAYVTPWFYNIHFNQKPRKEIGGIVHCKNMKKALYL